MFYVNTQHHSFCQSTFETDMTYVMIHTSIRVPVKSHLCMNPGPFMENKGQDTLFMVPEFNWLEELCWLKDKILHISVMVYS